MSDKYSSFLQLSRFEKEGTDYLISTREGDSDTLILVIHGGGIEPGTSEIGVAIAGSEHSLYIFEGIKYSRNSRLHITSINFDEPQAIRLAGGSERIVAIHGCDGDKEVVYVGGKDDQLAEKIRRELALVGVRAERRNDFFLDGLDERNICNKNLSSKGVQLEITHGLRVRMFNGLTRSGRRETTTLFWKFVQAVREALEAPGEGKPSGIHP